MNEPIKAPRVLLTGMSGTGKSSVVGELRKRGFRVIDMDDPGHSYRDSVGNQVWREDFVEKALSRAGALPLFISGCAENQVKFYSQLTNVILLSAPRDVILKRLSKRTNNPYGKTAAERAAVIRNMDDVEPLLRRGASYEIDTSAPLEEVVERILECVCVHKFKVTTEPIGRLILMLCDSTRTCVEIKISYVATDLQFDLAGDSLESWKNWERTSPFILSRRLRKGDIGKAFGKRAAQMQRAK
jgi:dephospho-CoA kinase